MNYEATNCFVLQRFSRKYKYSPPPLYHPTALPGRKTRNRQTALPAEAERPRHCPDNGASGWVWGVANAIDTCTYHELTSMKSANEQVLRS
jgi:hypothetical protein